VRTGTDRRRYRWLFLPFCTRPGVDHADGRQECAMDRSITCIEDLDLEISIAYLTLGGAREVWSRCPVAENQERVDAAEAEVNRLLDQRLTLQM
jgi:hypothetical protein